MREMASRHAPVATASVLASLLFVVLSLAAGCSGVPHYALAEDGGNIGKSDASVSTDGSAPPQDEGGIDAAGKRYGMFVTGSTVSGQMPGPPLVFADKLCKGEAEQGGYKGTWRAFLWVDAQPVPTARIPQPPGGWRQTLGGGRYGDVVVTDLSANGRTARPMTDALGNTVAATVWTGGNAESMGDTCGNWSQGDFVGTVGASDGVGGAWLSSGPPIKCSQALAALYCFEVD